MEEAPENRKESSHSEHANGMNEYYKHSRGLFKIWIFVRFCQSLKRTVRGGWDSTENTLMCFIFYFHFNFYYIHHPSQDTYADETHFYEFCSHDFSGGGLYRLPIFGSANELRY
jgi:hypothetical protein